MSNKYAGGMFFCRSTALTFSLTFFNNFTAVFSGTIRSDNKSATTASNVERRLTGLVFSSLFS